jgi:cholesterol oxidase
LSRQPAFDVIVVGSGFGGAVTACRAATSGARVLVLERGRRWTPDDYPRGKHAPWLFNVEKPQKQNGWLDVRLFKGMAVAQGAGLGGGSLCYSSVLLEAPPEIFANGWPAEITHGELRPHYERVASMLRPRTIPVEQTTRRFELLEQAARRTQNLDRTSRVPLAVTFDNDWSYGLPDAVNKRHTRPYVNPQGRWQGTCVHLGNCDIGCDVRAKNTLDLNYLALAEHAGADIRPLHLVRSIAPEGRGYRVFYERVDQGSLIPGSECGARVILAAGSLGSTEILLRSRDDTRSLPNVSPMLGRAWSPNANVLTPAIYKDADQVRQSVGPPISGMVDFGMGRPNRPQFVIEDDGFPNLLRHALAARRVTRWLSALAWSLGGDRPSRTTADNPLAGVMIWLGAGIDAGNGRLYLRRPWHAPWQRRLSLDWKIDPTRPVIDAILDVHRQFSEVTGGRAVIPLTWRWFRSLVTVHPLGGCSMGTTSSTGVVDHIGEVFGYPGLFVSDGSVIPRPIGRNPSYTIAALAERTSSLIFGTRSDQ